MTFAQWQQSRRGARQQPALPASERQGLPAGAGRRLGSRLPDDAEFPRDHEIQPGRGLCAGDRPFRRPAARRAALRAALAAAGARIVAGGAAGSCSSSWPSAASTGVRRTASSAVKHGRRCATSRPRSALRRTDLPPPACWNSSAGDETARFRAKTTLKTTFCIAPLTGAAGLVLWQGNLPACGPIPLLCECRFPTRPSRMIKPPSFLKIFTETGPLVVLGVTIALLVGIVGPASAQFFNFGGPPQRPAPRRAGSEAAGSAATSSRRSSSRRRKRVYQDFSKAPPPEKREAVPERNVLVMGDGMADWLAYGLEDAYTEQPDMGVIRKAKNTSGLIKYQPKGEPADWAAAAKGILATEKPDVDRRHARHQRPRRDARACGRKGRQGQRQGKVGRQEGRRRRTPAPNSDSKPADSQATAERQAGGQGRDQAGRQGRPTPSCRRTTMPTMRRAAAAHRRRPRVRRTASMNFATIAGSSSTRRRSRR